VNLATTGTQVGRGASQLRRVAGNDDQSYALFEKLTSDRLTDAAAAASNYRSFTGEF
jgi:hypothetical protein